MSRKQLALLEPTLVRQALLDAVKKLSPRAVAQPGDVYRLDGQSANHPAGVAMATAISGSAGLPPPSVSGCGLPCCSPTLPKRWRKAAVKRRPTA
jgi:hypothetical protein